MHAREPCILVGKKAMQRTIMICAATMTHRRPLSAARVRMLRAAAPAPPPARRPTRARRGRPWPAPPGRQRRRKRRSAAQQAQQRQATQHGDGRRSAAASAAQRRRQAPAQATRGAASCGGVRYACGAAAETAQRPQRAAPATPPYASQATARARGGCAAISAWRSVKAQLRTTHAPFWRATPLLCARAAPRSARAARRRRCAARWLCRALRTPPLPWRSAPKGAAANRGISSARGNTATERALRRVRTSSPSTSAAASQAPSEGCTPSSGGGEPGASDAARALRRDTRPMVPRAGAAHATRQLHGG